jgi:hypothetical protein
VPDKAAKPDSRLPENNSRMRIAGCFCLLNLLSINKKIIYHPRCKDSAGKIRPQYHKSGIFNGTSTSRFVMPAKCF